MEFLTYSSQSIRDALLKAFNCKVIPAIVLILLGAIVYSNTFNVPFILDDETQIVRNPVIKDPKFILDPLKLKHDHHDFPNSQDYQGISRNRIIGYITFAVNYNINDLDVAGYHFVNLVIHVINSLLIYYLLIITFKTTYFMDATGEDHLNTCILYNVISFFAAALFIVHPVQTQAVTYIVQRFTSLATTFYVLSFVLYAKFRLSGSTPKAVIYYLLSIMSAALAMMTKEISFTLPVLIALYEFILCNGDFKKRLLYVAPFSLTMLIIPINLIQTGYLSGNFINSVSMAAQETTEISRFDYLITQFRVVITYIRLLFIPVWQNIDYDYTIFRSLIDVQVFTSLLFHLLIICIAIYLVIRGRNKQNGYALLISFGVFWFYIANSVESSIIPIRDVIFEHRIYLPSIGFFIAIVTAVVSIRHTNIISHTYINKLMLFFTSIIVIFAVMTYSRNTLWQDEVGLWKDVVSKSPSKSRPYNMLGMSYYKKGLYEDAIRSYKKAIEIKPDYYDAHNNLGIAFIKTGRFEEGTREIQTAYAKGHYDAGRYYIEKGQYENAIREFKLAIKGMPYYAEAHNDLGIVYGETGRFEEAKSEFKAVTMLDPDNPEGYNNLGKSYAELAQYDDAIKEFENAIKLNPKYAEAHYNLGITYKLQSRYDEALNQFNIVVKLIPNHSGAIKQLNLLMNK